MRDAWYVLLLVVPVPRNPLLDSFNLAMPRIWPFVFCLLPFCLLSFSLIFRVQTESSSKLRLLVGAKYVYSTPDPSGFC